MQYHAWKGETYILLLLFRIPYWRMQYTMRSAIDVAYDVMGGRKLLFCPTKSQRIVYFANEMLAHIQYTCT
jgi:hypothetical protein